MGKRKVKDNSKLQAWLADRRNELRKRATPAELAFKNALDMHQLPYTFQKMCYAKGQCRIFDFFIRGYRIVVEIDGPYHDPEYDKKREADFLAVRPKKRRLRFLFLRFKNEEVFTDPNGCIKKLKQVMQARERGGEVRKKHLINPDLYHLKVRTEEGAISDPVTTNILSDF